MPSPTHYYHSNYHHVEFYHHRLVCIFLNFLQVESYIQYILLCVWQHYVCTNLTIFLSVGIVSLIFNTAQYFIAGLFLCIHSIADYHLSCLPCLLVHIYFYWLYTWERNCWDTHYIYFQLYQILLNNSAKWLSQFTFLIAVHKIRIALCPCRHLVLSVMLF